MSAVISGRNLEIECLRAIAILFTLFHHIPVYLFIQPTQYLVKIYSHFTFWGGVDLFFVISGFVIMKSFSRQLKVTNSLYGKSTKIFWIKRCFRILPPAWFWLIVYLLATHYTNYTGAFGSLHQNIEDAVAAVLQYANIYEVSSKSSGPNGIYWSLSLEEQFYIMLPIVIYVFRKYLVWFLVLAATVQAFSSRPEWSFGWALRTDGLIWGVLLAIWSEKLSYKKFEPKFLKNNLILRFVVIGTCILGMAYFPAKPNGVELGTGLVAIISALLVFLASYDGGYLFESSVLKKVLVWFGTRSYSLYLIHIIAYRFSYEILHQFTPTGYHFSINDSYWLLLIAIPLLLIVSEISFRLLEKPSRNVGLFLSSKIL